MSEVIPQTALQRVIPNAVLGRIGAVFLTGEAAVGLLGALAGPFLAQAVQLTGLATVASLVTLAAATLTLLTVPRMARPFRLQPKGLARANADGKAEGGNHSRWSELVMVRPTMTSPPPPARTGAGPGRPGAIRRGAARRRAA
jgi:hypothetical protein